MNNRARLTHAEAETLLQDYLANELEPREHRLVSEHLSHCSICQSTLKEIERIHLLLGGINEAAIAGAAAHREHHKSTSTIAKELVEHMQTRPQISPSQYNETRTNHRPSHSATVLPPRRRGLSQRLGLLAACILLVALAGSLFAFFSMARQHSRTGSGHTQKTATVQPTSPGIYIAAQNYLYKLDKTGKTKLWEQNLKDLTKSIVVANNVVYAYASPYQESSTVYAFRAQDGRQLWQAHVNTFVQQGSSQITDLNDLVVDQQNVYVISEDGKIYAINASTGTLRWSYADHPINPNGIPPRQLSVANNILYASVGSHFCAFDSTNGHMLWTKDAGSDETFFGPLVINDTVYVNAYTATPVPGYSKVYAWSASGKELWHSDQINDQVLPEPSSSGQQLYLIGTSTIYALNQTNGAIVWQSLIGLTNYSTPLFDQSGLYVGLQGPYKGTPAAGSDRPNAASVIALSRSDGSLHWEKTGFNHPIVQAIVDGVVYVTEPYNGNVYALKNTDGTMLWQYTELLPDPTRPQGTGSSLIVIP